MAKNEFLPFGIAEGANVLSNQEYERLAARFNGFVSGVAKSKELNTVWRQSSVMSSALAQFIVDSDNKDLLDNGDAVGVKNRLVAAIKQTISGVGYVTTAAMNLELNKKIDKASISGVLGNDNSKVPSLNLLTTELGKKQPAGNYAPAGDYATNTALNNGLSQKFDKTGGILTGGIIIGGNVNSTGDVIQLSSKKTEVMLQLDANTSTPRINSKLKDSNSWRYHSLQDKSGILAHTSDVDAAIAAIASLNKIVPIGATLIWNTSAPIPENFWANEGRSFSATDYPELAKVFPLLKLPDDRGYAIRAADNGRGKDQGRTVGTYQEDAMMNLTGQFTARSDSAGVATGVFTKGSASQTMSQGNNNILGTVSFNASNQVPTASEFRMKNVAKILITRMK
ncbi:hypothetical protein U3C50_001072 [Providencia rettgeri]|nr:hypothetical protein [Providencia rettgeri]